MTLTKIAKAKIAMVQIADEKLPYGMAATLAALDRAIEPLVAFYSKEELEICGKYGEQQSDGTWRIRDGMKADYLSAMAELNETDAPLQWQKPKVKAPSVISLSTLRSLEDFIEWEE